MPYEFRVHGGFVEFRLFGVIGPTPERVTPEERELMIALKSVLYDYADVTEIQFDPWLIADQLNRNVARGIRVAAVAASTAWFGVNRQIQSIAAAEPTMAQLFTDREDAIRWLQLR